MNEKEIITPSIFADIVKPLDFKLNNILIEIADTKNSIRNLII